jgi:hypothetical protein
MATINAIGAIGAALVDLIQERYLRGEFASEPEVDLSQTRNFTTPMTEAIGVFVYRIPLNATTRRAPDGRTSRPSLPLDLSVIVTSWADSAQRHCRWLVMRMLEDVGALTESQASQWGSA